MRTNSVMRPFVAALLCAAVYTSQAQAQATPFILMDGTPVKLRLDRTLSSATAQEGETVHFEVLEDIMVNGIAVVPRGSAALATVTDTKAKGRMGKAGHLNVNIDYVRLATGERAALRAIKQVKGGGNTGKMTGAIVATSLVFWPAAPFFLFMKGKDTTIPKGTEIIAYVNGDVRLDMVKFGAAQPQPAPAPAPARVQSAPEPAVQEPAMMLASTRGTSRDSAQGIQGMTIADVMELKKAGFTDDLIVAQVRASQAAFKLDTPTLVQLKKAGLSQTVIVAMIEKSQRQGI